MLELRILFSTTVCLSTSGIILALALSAPLYPLGASFTRALKPDFSREFDQTTQYNRREFDIFATTYLNEDWGWYYDHATIFWLSIVYCKELIRLDSRYRRCKVVGFDPNMELFSRMKVLKERYDQYVKRYDRQFLNTKEYNLRGVIFSLRLMLANLYSRTTGKGTRIEDHFDQDCYHDKWAGLEWPTPKADEPNLHYLVSNCFYNASSGSIG